MTNALALVDATQQSMRTSPGAVTAWGLVVLAVTAWGLVVLAVTGS
jgi:hypothetical protein